MTLETGFLSSTLTLTSFHSSASLVNRPCALSRDDSCRSFYLSMPSAQTGLLLAILLLRASWFLPVCLVPLFVGARDIPGQNLTALWDCCYYNLFTSWLPFPSALGTLSPAPMSHETDVRFVGALLQSM